MTSKEATLAMIKSRTWVHGEDIEEAGGSLRRLREFRAEGYEIKKRPSDWGGYEYRLVSRPKVAA